MAGLLVDTYPLAWYLINSPKLSGGAKLAIENAFQLEDPVYVSSLSLGKILELVERRRIPSSTLDRILYPGPTDRIFTMVPFDQFMIPLMNQIPRTMVLDLVDRMIGATALFLNVPVVTHSLILRSVLPATIW